MPYAPKNADYAEKLGDCAELTYTEQLEKTIAARDTYIKGLEAANEHQRQQLTKVYEMRELVSEMRDQQAVIKDAAAGFKECYRRFQEKLNELQPPTRIQY